MYQSAQIIFNIIKGNECPSDNEEKVNENYCKIKNEYTWKAKGGHVLLEDIDGTQESIDSAADDNAASTFKA